MVHNCLMEMLAAWLRRLDNAVNPTWKQLIESLKGMGENGLAERIEKNYRSDSFTSKRIRMSPDDDEEEEEKESLESRGM